LPRNIIASAVESVVLAEAIQQIAVDFVTICEMGEHQPRLDGGAFIGLLWQQRTDQQSEPVGTFPVVFSPVDMAVQNRKVARSVLLIGFDTVGQAE